MFSYQGKDASKPAGNWFQLLTVVVAVYFQTLLLTYQFIRPHIPGDIDSECSTSMPQYSFKREGGLNKVLKAVTANSTYSLCSLPEAPPGEQVDLPSVTEDPLVSRWLGYLRYLE